jgi:hypothetical protein
VEQELPLEGGGREAMPRHQEDCSVGVDDARAGDTGQGDQIVVGRQAKFEVRRSKSQIE